MPLLRSLSIYQLICISFVAVVVPLGVALTISLLRVDDLAALSRVRVFDTQKLTVLAKSVADALPDLERDALEYRLLRDAPSDAAYAAERKAFLGALDEVDALGHHRQLRERVAQIRAGEQQIHRVIADKSDAAQAQTVAQFSGLFDLTDALLADIDRIVAADANQVPADAERLQMRLLWQVGALLPVTLIVGAWLFWVVSRPLRRVETAIGRLGRGEFNTPVRIDGPKDLEEVGRRLDWLRTRLVELEAQKSSFLRNISHELKTPLTSIREGAELLREDYAFAGSPEQRKIVQILRDNSIRLQALIENLLRFSKQEWQWSAAHFGRVAIDAVVRDVIADHCLAMTKKNVRVTEQIARADVLGDREQLRAIVDNLISNAIKFSPEGGTIDVAVAMRADEVSIDVSDAGPGIDECERDLIFGLFYQGKRAPAATVEGTGMGLAIAKEYVELHRGRIAVVDSVSGAHLRVNLPRHQ